MCVRNGVGGGGGLTEVEAEDGRGGGGDEEGGMMRIPTCGVHVRGGDGIGGGGRRGSRGEAPYSHTFIVQREKLLCLSRIEEEGADGGDGGREGEGEDGGEGGGVGGGRFRDLPKCSIIFAIMIMNREEERGISWMCSE